MLTNLPHLPEAQRKQLAGLVTSIVKAVSPEKIICYGCRNAIIRDWSCFLAVDGYHEATSTVYDLLVITNANEKRADHEIIQMAEQQAEPFACRVTMIVHKLTSANEAIEKNSRFFTTLFHKGILLYNGNNQSLAVPTAELTAATVKSRIEKSWNKEFITAQRFYDTAGHCLSNGWYELCVFMLHQSVQHGCMALLKVFMGYRSETHNLTRLLALTENFSPAPAAIFPRITKEETELFNLLRHAYSDARYNEDYTVSADKAAILAARIKQLLTIAELLYCEKLNSLDKESIISFPLTLNDVTEKIKQ